MHVIVIGKTDHLCTRVEIRLFPMHDRQTHALSRKCTYTCEVNV